MRKLKDGQLVETSEVQCRRCSKLKTRILAGKYKKDKKWVSPEGGVWNGRVCSECHSLQVYKSRVIKNEIKKLDENS